MLFLEPRVGLDKAQNMRCNRRRYPGIYKPREPKDGPKANAGAGWDSRRPSGQVFDINDYDFQQSLAEEFSYGNPRSS
jgi:hypothetical protein